MGERLADGNMALALLDNTLATGAILGTLRWRPDAVAFAVGLFITAGYWFTASTSFANPAVTIARSLTDTVSGIDPAHVPAFIVAQVMGAMLAAGLFTWFLHPVPHNSSSKVAGAVEPEPAER